MRVAVSFTGGKDSVLATHLILNAQLREIARWTGEGDVVAHRGSDGGGGSVGIAPIRLPPEVHVACLVTFGPPASSDDNGDDDDRGFKAHPLKLVRQQAAALAAGIAASSASSSPPPPLPWLMLDVVAPHADSYAQQLMRLREEHKIDALVTGDVLDVCNGFMARACVSAGLVLVTPLWDQPRERILCALEALHIRAFVTCVDVRKFAGSDVDPLTSVLGRELTRAVWQGPDAPLQRAEGVDLCGEGGEFHTAVFEAPHLFSPRALRIELSSGHEIKGESYAHVVLLRVSSVGERQGAGQLLIGVA
jgi:diphthamide synthase (EF-2-diphthine--ammonia ligase)